MFALLIALTALSGIALLVGVVWLLVGSGAAAQESTEGKPDDQESRVSQSAAYEARTSSPEREKGVSFVEIKAQARAGQWGEALPILLAVAGFLGLLLFGSLALFVALEDKLVGGLIAAVAVFSVARVVVAMARV